MSESVRRSPGVFTNEVDRSQPLGADLQLLGPAVIGPTTKGPDTLLSFVC